MARHRYLYGVVAMALLAGLAGCGRWPGTHPGPQEAYAWFDTLGFPDVKGRKYVHVATGLPPGGWYLSGSVPLENSYLDAFLLSDDGETFTALTHELTVETFRKTGAETAEHERVAYKELDLEKEATAFLTRLKDRFRHRFGQRLAEGVQVFALARACARHGLGPLAQQLYEQAVSMLVSEDGQAGEGKPPDLIHRLQHGLGHAMMWRAVVAFGDPTVTRERLLADFEAIIRDYPASEHVPRAKQVAGILRRMIREDEAHAKRPQRPLEEMPVKERVAELVFLLRDQNGQQRSQPGACDIFLDPREDASPAHRLLDLGYDAVPVLVEALADDRLTRSVGYWRHFCFSHEVLRVRDCALDILERIACRTFGVRKSAPCTRLTDEEAATAQKEARAWWAKFCKKGEQQTLAEAVARGDKNSPWQASRLVGKCPDAAVAAITVGLTRATDNGTRNMLVRIAGEIKGDGPVALLLEEMRSGPLLEARAEAAIGLHRHGRPEAGPAMIAEWRKAQGEPPERLIEFLLGCGSAEAVRALGEGSEKESARLCIAIIHKVAEASAPVAPEERHIHTGFHEQGEREHSAAVLEAMEALLVGFLDKTDEQTGVLGSWGEKSYADPRVCDMAGHALWMQWPDRYSFDLAASPKVRDRQRFECLNVWRARHGQAPLPLPRQRAIPPLPEEQIRPLLERVRAATAEADIKAAAGRVEALGLPALPHVRRFLAGLPKDHPARRQVQALAERLSCVVAEVTLAKGSVALDAPLAEKLAELQGNPLSADRYISVLLHVAQTPPQGATGIRLKAVREDDLTGVTLFVNLVTTTAEQEGSGGGYSTAQRVVVGSEYLLGSFGTMAPGWARNAESYEELRRAVEKALASAPDVPFVISSSLIGEK